jgi:hypothetical protein
VRQPLSPDEFKYAASLLSMDGSESLKQGEIQPLNLVTWLLYTQTYMHVTYVYIYMHVCIAALLFDANREMFS